MKSGESFLYKIKAITFHHSHHNKSNLQRDLTADATTPNLKFLF